jgi:hypothetical protein
MVVTKKAQIGNRKSKDVPTQKSKEGPTKKTKEIPTKKTKEEAAVKKTKDGAGAKKTKEGAGAKKTKEGAGAKKIKEGPEGKKDADMEIFKRLAALKEGRIVIPGRILFDKPEAFIFDQSYRESAIYLEQYYPQLYSTVYQIVCHTVDTISLLLDHQFIDIP